MNCCNSKTVWGGHPNAGDRPQESLRGPFASPQHTASPVARSVNPGYELRRVTGNRDTVTSRRLIAFDHDWKTHGCGCFERPSPLNCTARRNANADLRCEFEEMRATAGRIITRWRAKRDFEQMAQFSAYRLIGGKPPQKPRRKIVQRHDQIGMPLAVGFFQAKAGSQQ
jgi:hypothetical protein